ncbi:MAG: ATP-binding protein [Thermodesulfobacteriota bacterium]
MANRPLRRQLFAAALLLVAVTGSACTLLFFSFLKAHSIRSTQTSLVRQARLLQDDLLVFLETGRQQDIDQLCKKSGRLTGLRYTVILPSGDVVGDSDEEPRRMDNHGGRPEIREAMAAQSPAFSLRHSDTLQRRMLYAAIPLLGSGSPATVVGVLRCSLAFDAIDADLVALARTIIAAVLLILGMAGSLALYLSGRLSRPLSEVERMATRLAEGDFSLPGPALSPGGRPMEIAALDGALRKLAANLERRIGAMVSRHQELETVFAGMVEAVIVVGRDGRLRKLNRAAVRMLGVEEERAMGRRMLEAVRNVELQEMVAHLLGKSGEDHLEKEIVVADNEEERILQAYGGVLVDEDGETNGALIVLHDVTRLKRLENLRRDFVANVSHELKTPITTIKGFVETLLDGAAADPQTATGFLRIIEKNVDRLTAIIEDLLMLSRIERDEEGGEIEMADIELRRVLAGAMEICQPQAAAKGISLDLRCDDALPVRLNGPLIEQAVVNLVINAVKYSDPGREVVVRGGMEGTQIRIEVEDQGIGIAAQHLPRLFERFYRSDKARSRKLGGTGLGLSIVKHIVQAHHGTVSVRSIPGRGTTFTILLPGARLSPR